MWAQGGSRWWGWGCGRTLTEVSMGNIPKPGQGQLDLSHTPPANFHRSGHTPKGQRGLLSWTTSGDWIASPILLNVNPIGLMQVY